MSNDGRHTECIAERSTERSEVIRYLAEWLGWLIGPWHGDGTHIAGPMSKTLMYWDDDDIILFGAYVEAELNKRGWYMQQREWKSVWFFHDSDLTRMVKACVYSRADPIAKANAILLCANEVRRMEREGEG